MCQLKKTVLSVVVADMIDAATVVTMIIADVTIVETVLIWLLLV